MLSLGPSPYYYPEHMPAAPSPFAAIHPRDNNNHTRPSISNESRCSNQLRGPRPRPRPRPRPASQIGKLCPFPYRKEKEDERRRAAFLKKVRDAGEARRWEQRGDTILREDYVSSQKRWEEQQVKTAPQAPILPEDEEMELKAEVSRSEEAEMIDDMLQQERKELEALLGLFENESSSAEQETHKTDYGSEDEDFNRDCLEALSASEVYRPTLSRSSEGIGESYVPMDMSID